MIKYSGSNGKKLGRYAKCNFNCYICNFNRHKVYCCEKGFIFVLDKGPCSFLRRDNCGKKVKLHRRFLEIFSRATEPLLTNFGSTHPWVNRNKISSNALYTKRKQRWNNALNNSLQFTMLHSTRTVLSNLVPNYMYMYTYGREIDWNEGSIHSETGDY